ncbi:hypothetical protein T484DRAFT_1617581, partial [Baffinella frigidus]
VVRCRGLPFNATDRDVKEFFAGLSVEWEGVVLSIGADGRPNGEAFVKFEESGDVTKALARDRQKMERRYVEVFLGKESDMKEALKDVERSKKVHGDRGGGEGSGFVRLRGLPYTAKEEEIIDFFKGIKVGPPPPLSKTVLRKWSLRRDGRPNGEAYVELAHEDDLDAALEKNKASLGSRYVEVRFRLHRLGLVWGLCNMM